MVNVGEEAGMDIDLGGLMNSAILQVQQNWVSLAAAVVSIASAVLAVRQKRQEMRIAWVRDLVSWASEAMLALSSAQVEVEATEGSEVAAGRRKAIRSQLSAAVDRGRLFFENKQGLRPGLLDPLVRAFDLLSTIEREPTRYTRDHLVACMNRHRTDFWKLVQAKVDPEWITEAVQGPRSDAGDGAWDFDKLAPSR
jgi:hypothetical protein